MLRETYSKTCCTQKCPSLFHTNRCADRRILKFVTTDSYVFRSREVTDFYGEIKSLSDQRKCSTEAKADSSEENVSVLGWY